MLKQIVINNKLEAIDARKNSEKVTSLREIKPSIRKNGIEILKKFLTNSSEAIIIDPFFYKGAAEQSVESYIDELKDVFSNFTSISRIHIIYNQSHCNGNIRKTFIDNSNCKITDIHSSEIHDRIWIKDRKQGKLVGSSFNGLGRSKICFIVNLPKQDLIDLKFFLQRKNLVPKDFLVIED
ncbi:hypothetical protein ACVNRM_04210 [Bacillus paranthracis]|uniref:hypothetical protein n=1 Tax=Bacillus TaxID=1386 RepID=UPI00016B8A91|nr:MULTISPECIES: hypothetical protein [Bacillus]EDZ55352.1 hypothetical protein BCH308197_1311 [Bacillus cereus H3081.97]EJQ11162.1 hypothetical protein IC5_00407 [Bacillus cereus AND1407]KFL80888.1 hypothetical protein DJ51_1429 [Bacillus cereus]MRA61288.1 hypothetical protein [Bacillus thuringiensis]OUB91980.1 hypothetical protein BK752_29300 [Bacillus thuringiensis serovar canadensis]